MDFTPPSNMLDFQGKVVLVTGGGFGIGAGIAKRFAAAGADVAINFRSHEQEAMEVAGSIESLGRKAMALRADVSDPRQVEDMFDELSASWSPVDVLVNNAGIYPHADFLTMTVAEWDETININLRGVFLCTQAAAKRMVQANKSGAIVNIGSIEGMNPAAGHCHYAASKAGVAMFSANAALELGPYNIRVNTVSPGLIDTGSLATNWPEGQARWLSRAPLGRVGQPADIGDACLFLASEAARWITGIQLIVDGGVMTCQIY